MDGERTVIATDQAPAAVGPYSQAIAAGELIFTAGQIPLDPATGTLVKGDIQAQARRVLQNLQAILEAAGTALPNVVKATVFLKNIDDFQAVNQVYAQFFPGNPPARSVVQVVNLPLGADLMIETIASLG
jgi:2-iminobutanoate/2-iminopropanoate deaminase